MNYYIYKKEGLRNLIFFLIKKSEKYILSEKFKV